MEDENKRLSIKEFARLTQHFGLRIDQKTGSPKFYRIAPSRKANKPSSYLRSGYMTTANHHINRLEEESINKRLD